jgi:hypothetical protein
MVAKIANHLSSLRSDGLDDKKVWLLHSKSLIPGIKGQQDEKFPLTFG